MKAVYFVATVLVGVIMFWVGFQVRPLLDPWEQQEAAAVLEDESVDVQQTEQSAAELAALGYLPLEELKVRIDDGDVQWFDGMMWHTVASMEELAKEDKFYMAQEDFLEFEEKIKQQREERRAEQENPEEWGETLLVGQKEAPKSADNSRANKPATTAPAEEPVSDPAALPESGGSSDGNPDGNNGGGDNSDSGNSGSNGGGGNPDSGSSGINGGEGNPAGDGGNSGNGGSTGDNSNVGSGDSGTDTGDGENMEWSDDYL